MSNPYGRPIHHQRSNNRWTAAYNSWRCMKQRCNNPKHKSYGWYGALGITYPASWEKFEGFWYDMGDPPGDGKYDLGRLDETLSYSRGNCEWQPRLYNRGRRG